jgi:hypothetical protein
LDEVIRIWLQKLKLSKYFKELIFNTLLFADDQLIIADTEDYLQRAVYLLYNISKEYNLEIATGKMKVFGFVGTDHLRAKVITNDETLDQVSQFTYLACSISYQFSNDVELKLAKILQLIGTIKRTIFRKVRTENILKLYNTLVLPRFLYGSEKWSLAASHRRRIEAAEVKLLRPMADYALYDYKTNDSIRRELQTDCILDKTDEYRRNWLLLLQRMPQNRIPLKSYLYSPQGKRTNGRSKKRWREQL